MEACIREGMRSDDTVLHVADFYLRGPATDGIYRHIFTFDLHPDSILEICRQVEARLVVTGLISAEQFTDWLNLLGLYLARHGLYIESSTLLR